MRAAACGRLRDVAVFDSSDCLVAYPPGSRPGLYAVTVYDGW